MEEPATLGDSEHQGVRSEPWSPEPLHCSSLGQGLGFPIRGQSLLDAQDSDGSNGGLVDCASKVSTKYCPCQTPKL